MNLLTKVVRMPAESLLEVKADGKIGKVKALRSVTENIDFQGDRIRAGAFAKVNAQIKAGDLRWPVMAWSHQIDLLPTGKVRDVDEWLPGDKRLPQKFLDQGLGGEWVSSEYDLDTQLGHDVFSLVSKGMLEESSFMFWPSKVTYIEPKNRLSADHLQDLDEIGHIVEFSDVVMGANPDTAILQAKKFFSFPAGMTPEVRRAVDILIAAALTPDKSNLASPLPDDPANIPPHVPDLTGEIVAMALGAGINAGLRVVRP